MDKNKRNALQRARLSSGLTQEALAELINLHQKRLPH